MIEQMLKSQIVTVCDIKEIEDTVNKQQVWKCWLCEIVSSNDTACVYNSCFWWILLRKCSFKCLFINNILHVLPLTLCVIES
jgi:hypothetical protein